MKKLILLAFIAIGCNASDGNIKITTIEDRTKDNRYETIVIDSCEYIEYRYMEGFETGLYGITHKGNCKNPIHQK